MNDCDVRPLDRDWAERYLTQNDHQVANSFAWFEFLQSYSHEDDRSVSLYCDKQPVGFVLALQYRSLIQSLPYPASYGGVFLTPELDDTRRNAVYERLFDHYERLADVFTISATPFVAASNPDCEQFDFVGTNKIQYIDLHRDLLDGTTSKFRNNLKRNLRRAEEHGVRVDDSSNEANLRLWFRCYQKRMCELDANALDYDYFALMRQHLSQTGNFQLFSAYEGDQYLGGIIVVYNHYCAEYYLGVFDRERDGTQASSYLFYYALNRLKNAGIRYFNLQASPKSQPTLWEFKKSWGALEGSHNYLVKILKNKDKLLSRSIDEIKREYAFHYLAPFEAWTGAGTIAESSNGRLQTQT